MRGFFITKMTIEYDQRELTTQTDFKIFVAGQNHSSLAPIISQWTRDAATMLPKSSDEILGMFQKGHSVLVFDNDETLVSHASITYVYSDGSVEVGCVVTDVNRRKKGAGTTATKAIIKLAKEMNPDKTIFALANSASAPIFEKLGARKMETTELSDEVWGPCATCPKRPLQTPGKPPTCCDIPYDVTQVII